MSIFSKLGRSISSGFSTGLTQGLQDLSTQYENERKLRLSQQVQAEGSIARSAYAAASGPRERGATGLQVGNVDPVYTVTEIDKFGQDVDNLITQTQTQYLTGQGKRGQSQIVEDVTLNTLNTQLLALTEKQNEVSSYLQVNSQYLTPKQKGDLTNQLNLLNAEQKKLQGTIPEVIKRDTQDPTLQAMLVNYSGVYTGIGYEGYANAQQQLGGNPDYVDQVNAEQRLVVVQEMMNQQGGFRKARQFANKYGEEDQTLLLDLIDSAQATAELGITRKGGAELASKAVNQTQIQHAYELVNKGYNAGQEKAILMRQLMDRSMTIMERDAALYSETVEKLSRQIANDQNKVISQEARLNNNSLANVINDSQTQQQSTATQRQDAVTALNPSIRREAIRQANAAFPHIAKRRQYNNRLIGDLTVSDVVAIGALQQVNLGSSPQVALESIQTDKALTLEEKTKAIQLFESVGQDIGLDTMVSDALDSETLTQIHQGFPAWWDQKTVIEDRVFEYGKNKIISAAGGTDANGTPLPGGPQNEIELIEAARIDLERRERIGQVPVGATQRIHSRLINEFMGSTSVPVLIDADEVSASSPQAPQEEEVTANVSGPITKEAQEIIEQFPEAADGDWSRLTLSQKAQMRKAGIQEFVRNIPDYLRRGVGLVGEAVASVPPDPRYRSYGVGTGNPVTVQTFGD